MSYADPGYYGEPRLPLDSDDRVRAAWAFMTVARFGDYTIAQRETIKARIQHAATERGLRLDSANARKVEADVTVVESAPRDMSAAKVRCTKCDTDYFVDGPDELPAGSHPSHKCEIAEEMAEEIAAGHTGCMVALYPASEVQDILAIADGEPAGDIHVTLAYLGDAASLDLERLNSVVAGVAQGAVPMDGEISGLGVFTANLEAAVTYASVDVPALAGFRQRLFDALVAASFPVATNHGYTPHMTISYSDQRGLVIPNLRLAFEEVWVVAADEKTAHELRGDEKPYDPNEHGAPEPAKEQPKGYVDESKRIKISAESPEAKAAHDFKAAQWTHPNGHPRCKLCGDEEPIGGRCNDPASVRDAMATAQSHQLVAPTTALRQAQEAVENLEPAVPLTKAFVTELNGKMILTAPIETLRAELVASNPHFLWMEGAFVGAEEANRNGAFWSTADLEFGEFTVKNGPVNWLHEARHVIGSITDGHLVTEATHAASRRGALTLPHIRATAAVWKWIYPEEAQVIEFAAEAGSLWWSMECISEEIKCIGDGGCGQSFPYMKAMKGNACEHILSHSSIRQLVKPTFLGGAILVPPVRPGWARADVRILREASAFAGKSYEDAGRPDIEANVWDQLMAELVVYARG